MSLDEAIRRSLHRQAEAVRVDPDAWAHFRERSDRVTGATTTFDGSENGLVEHVSERSSQRSAMDPRPRARIAIIAMGLLVPAITTYALFTVFGSREATRSPDRLAASNVAAEPGSQGELLYAKNDGLRWSLYALDPVTGVERRITDGAVRDYASDWSPDGTRVVFDREVDDSDLGGIWVADADGSNATQLVANGRFPAWSPDGSTIAFVHSEPGHGHGSSIYVMAADGSGVHPLTSGSVDFCPLWSPDGSQIAFLRHGVGLMVVGADGSGSHQIGDPELVGSLGTPDWSPDGTSIVAGINPKQGGATGGIALVASDGSGEMTFVPGTEVEFPDYVSNPVWSPDGRWIAYMGQSRGAIVIVHPDGSDAHTLHVDPGFDTMEQLDWGVASQAEANDPSPQGTASSTPSSPMYTGSHVVVLNGTNQVGLATLFAERMAGDGYDAGEPGDAPAKPVDVTVVYYATGADASENAVLAQKIADRYFTGQIGELPQILADIVGKDVRAVVVLGTDADQ